MAPEVGVVGSVWSCRTLTIVRASVGLSPPETKLAITIAALEVRKDKNRAEDHGKKDGEGCVSRTVRRFIGTLPPQWFRTWRIMQVIPEAGIGLITQQAVIKKNRRA